MPPSRKEFVDANKHVLAGIVMDAVTGKREGTELSWWLSLMMRRIETDLGVAYDQFFPPQPAPNTEIKPSGPSNAQQKAPPNGTANRPQTGSTASGTVGTGQGAQAANPSQPGNSGNRPGGANPGGPQPIR